MMKRIKKYMPDKHFARRYFKVALPIILQQVFINSAIMIDNFMVGTLGKDSVLAIGSVNAIQLFFMLTMFGVTYGSGIYLSQYNGADQRKKMILSAAIKQQLLFIYSIISVVIIWYSSPTIIKLFIKDIPSNQNAINLAIGYQRIFAFSILFKAQNYGFSTTFQELGQPDKGMKASIVSVIVNVVMNYFLIFGIAGFPKLGLIGAAYGTVLSKIASFLVWNFILDTKIICKRIWLVMWKNTKEIFKQVIRKSAPLLISEMLWVLAMVIKSRVFSTYGADDFTAFSIQMNMETMVNVVWAGMWGATVYLVGKKLGSNRLDHAEERAKKLIGMTMLVGIVASITILTFAIPMLRIYNVGPAIKSTALQLIMALALFFPLRLLCGAYFFIIRASGQSKQSMKIDLISSWLVMIPTVFIAKYSLGYAIVMLFIMVELTNIFKVVYGSIVFRKYHWLKSLVKEEE